MNLRLRDLPRLLLIGDAAVILGVAHSTASRYASQGKRLAGGSRVKLPTIRLGNVIVTTEADVRDFHSLLRLSKLNEPWGDAPLFKQAS